MTITLNTRWFSLRRRLLWLLLGGVSLGWLTTVAFSYIDAHHEVDEMFDAQLAQAGQVLLAMSVNQLHETDDHGIGEMEAQAHKYQRRLRFQLWRSDGALWLRSANAPVEPLTGSDGFSETVGTEGRWRHFSQWNEAHSLQVQVSEDHLVRDELIAHIAWRLLLPALFGLPLLGVLVWLATYKGLSALDGVAKQIDQRDPKQLQAVQPDAAPEEIRGLLEAINGLLGRVAQAMAGERRFTADAAHELRTPLAALSAQLQVALRARDSAEHEAALHQLQFGLDRAVRLVEQLLLLARLDPQEGLPSSSKVNLAELLESVCAEQGGDIIDKQLDFNFAVTGESAVHYVEGQTEWLRILFRNLLDNAIRYTPAGGSVRVELSANAGNLWVDICDAGPGIPLAAREQVFERFLRLDTTGQSGCGLGLSIVRRIADLHGAKLALADAPEGGLAVRMGFKA